MIHFLSGIPRSGSTLLASLLSQRPGTHVSATSGLCEIIGAAVHGWENSPAQKASGQGDVMKMIGAIASAHYQDHSEDVVIDKARGWAAASVIGSMKIVQGEVKIIATVRPIADCLASFVNLVKPDNVEAFCKNSELAGHLFSSYHTLRQGFDLFPDCFLFIEYDDMIADPQGQVDRVAEFLGYEPFTLDTDNVVGVKEDDTVWGVKGLHKVRKKVGKRKFSRKNLLGKKLWCFFQGAEFWNDKPEPVREIDDLDRQLKASLYGDPDTAEKISDRLLKERPECNRVAFNAGWYALRRGDLLEGHRLLDRGRNEDVWGNRHIGSQAPIWRGELGTVLLSLEAGLGDQFHGLRFAHDLRDRGNRVVISCSPELAPIFAEQFTVVQPVAALGAYHDYWLPSMSAVTAFGYEYEDLSGKPYIERTSIMVPGRIGVRWSGNPKFEHEQHRRFPSELLFGAVDGLDCVSLQRDDGVADRPHWMPQANVATWADTRRSISECELVITSCTSVAHLAAAMGVKTWIVLPVLPYYLWALPGEKTPWYDSVRLFRQETYGEWYAPFNNIKECSQCWHKSKMAA